MRTAVPFILVACACGAAAFFVTLPRAAANLQTLGFRDWSRLLEGAHRSPAAAMTAGLLVVAAACLMAAFVALVIGLAGGRKPVEPAIEADARRLGAG